MEYGKRYCKGFDYWSSVNGKNVWEAWSLDGGKIKCEIVIHEEISVGESTSLALRGSSFKSSQLHKCRGDRRDRYGLQTRLCECKDHPRLKLCTGIRAKE